MNREQKEHQIVQLYKDLLYSDKVILAHAVSTYGIESSGPADAFQKMTNEEFERFYSDVIPQFLPPPINDERR